MPHQVKPRTYLLVHHGALDVADPALRYGLPITFGACRGDMRRVAGVGSRFVFIANVKPAKNDPTPRYHLSAYCKVAERIGQDEAQRRFGGRSNVEIDALAPGASLESRVLGYATQHQRELKWADFAGVADVARHIEDYLLLINGVHYIHSYWDHHKDWKARMSQPYLVSDQADSRIFTPRIPYADLVRVCPTLPAPDQLQNGWGIHPRRNLSEWQVDVLSAWWDRRGEGNGTSSA